jgi:hypothetical protein
MKIYIYIYGIVIGFFYMGFVAAFNWELSLFLVILRIIALWMFPMLQWTIFITVLLNTALSWGTMLHSWVEVYWHFGGMYVFKQTLLAVCLFAFWAYSLALKMEAECSFEVSAYFYQTTQCHIPEDGILHSHSLENFISHMHYSWLWTMNYCTWLCECEHGNML